MSLNLLKDPWLSFVLRDGSEKTLPMCHICDPDVVDFALPRADFQGAAYQFAIGLLQTVFAPIDGSEWHELYEQPASMGALQEAFNRVAHAFNATGDGPLFMQDLAALSDAKPTTVSGLLIEAPGVNGLKLNTDHFIKRGIGGVMSLDMAMLALFTLQTNAPSGGQGHRTGLRGGGPLTTLIMPPESDSSLWQKLWLNVINKDHWPEAYSVSLNFNDSSIFPWLEKTKISNEKNTEIYQADVHPLHMYWAMPRRIRLNVEQENGTCQLSGKEVSLLVTTYKTINYGGNYSGEWLHPLTPYKWNPKKPTEEPLSAKGQPGGITYKIWDALTLTDDEAGQRCAMVVDHFYSIVDQFEIERPETPRLWVFAYDMDNMKSRGWYSSTMPLFSVTVKQQEDLLNKVRVLQKIASGALWQCRTQIKAAWFDKPSDAKGDMSFIDLAFWQRTEHIFYTTVQNITANASKNEPYLMPEQASRWLVSLRSISTDIFDEYALSSLGSERSMAKRIKARQSLTGWLYGNKNKDIKNFIIENEIDKLGESNNRKVEVIL